MNGYELSRAWFDFCFDNPEKINPNHTAIYFFAIEHCNRLGWKEKFGFPTQMSMDALGIKKHQTYIKYFNDLCEWGFFKLIQKSTNQYSANIICLQNAMPNNSKALDKAIITHTAKQTQSNGQSNSSIDKQQTTKQQTIKQSLEERCLAFANSLAEFKDAYSREMLLAFKNYWTEPNQSKTKMRFELEKTFEVSRRLATWSSREKVTNQKPVYTAGKLATK